MIYTIIIDDEETIREGLRKYISRNFPEFEITGVFPDGKDAIEFLDENHADIVITDIMMSEKSGIDVAKYLCENSPETKTVFLSAYQEFDYAKQAIKFNVKYYLSKPVRLTELTEVLTSLKDKFLEEKKIRFKTEKDSEELRDLIAIAKRDFYSDILLKVIDSRELISSRGKKIHLSENFLSQTPCAIFTILASPGDSCYYGTNETHTCIFNLLSEISGVTSVISLIQEKHDSVYLCEFQNTPFSDNFESLLKLELCRIADKAKELLSITIEHNILFCGKDIFSLLIFHGFSENSFSAPALIEDKFKTLLSQILLRDYEGAKDTLNAIRVYSQSLPITDSRSLMSGLLSKINSIFSEDFQLSETQFDSCTDQDALFDAGNMVLSSIFEQDIVSDSAENTTILKAKKFISEHISEDIGLEDIAGCVYLNPVYFSRFFKQHTGLTMTEYLTNARINLACEMLRSHKHKIHEISKACGYKSSKYFAKIFKQCTGQTPSDYSKIN